MARIRWQGQEFRAEPVRQLPNGNWIMRAQSHGARFGIGTEIEVTPGEVLEMAAAESPADPTAGLSQLEAAMATERETLPSPQQIIATSPPIAHDAPDKVVSVSPDPTQRP